MINLLTDLALMSPTSFVKKLFWNGKVKIEPKFYGIFQTDFM